MNELTWVEDTNAGVAKRNGIRTFQAEARPGRRFTIYGQGPEDAAGWYPCISVGFLFRRVAYLANPPVPMTLAEARQACADYPLPDL